MKNNHPIKTLNDLQLAITVTLRESRLLEDMVEGMAGIRHDAEYGRKPVLPGWRAIETSTVDSYAGGDMTFSSQVDLSQVSFVSCFLFTCIKNQVDGYDLAWSCSLS